jgi:UDP-N-acetylglucosamine 2-epimerase (non-hydrolysing)
VLGRILDAVAVIQEDMPVVFPMHPRTRKNLESGELALRVKEMPGLRMLDPLGYLEFLKLMAHARLVLTDSGGIQEETTILDVPCLTLRENTERPVTVVYGSNMLVGMNAEKIVAAYRLVESGLWKKSRIPPLWDGKAAERIARSLADSKLTL